MTCRELSDFILAYLEDELTPAVRQAFEEHLAVCPTCVDYLNSYRLTIVIAKRAMGENPCAPTHAIPEELVRAILAARDVAISKVVVRSASETSAADD